jgi:hypothetical protein
MGFTYSDIMMMPTYQRRYFLGLLSRDHIKRQERIEEMREKAITRQGKGSRTTKLSGEALKNRIISGQIPNK